MVRPSWERIYQSSVRSTSEWLMFPTVWVFASRIHSSQLLSLLNRDVPASHHLGVSLIDISETPMCVVDDGVPGGIPGSSFGDDSNSSSCRLAVGVGWQEPANKIIFLPDCQCSCRASRTPVEIGRRESITEGDANGVGAHCESAGRE
jgi:hypothetical protein